MSLAVSGAFGDNLRMDYTAVGDTANLAARLQQLAEPNQILVSESTHQTVEGYCNTKFLGEMPVKGIREPVRAWEVLSGRGSRTRLEIEAESGLTPFIGREREVIDGVKSGLQHSGLQNSLAGDSLIRRVYELSKI